MKRLLATVDSRGSTDLFDGWEDGAKKLEKGQDSIISRVPLKRLTDSIWSWS